MKKLHVILRTHSGPNVHGGTRVLNLPKDELIAGCLRSLVVSLHNVDTSKYSVRLSILDDHSTSECISKMEDEITQCNFKTELINLTESGNGASFGASYRFGRDNDNDIIYFVEDDYLHTPEALTEMLDAQELFSKNLGQEVAIYPVDYPDRYAPQFLRPSYIVVGRSRHWRTIDSTTGTFMISRRAFLANFDNCMGMSKYGIDPQISEDNTINRIWRYGGVHIFSPIPSLALHMQYDDTMPPFVNPSEWWEKFAKS